MLDRILSSLVALSLALLVWLYLRSRDQEMLDDVPIPVHIALAPAHAEHYELEVNGPSQVPVSFTGPPSRIRELRGLLQRGELVVEYLLTVPEERLRESRYLDTVRIEASDVQTPPGVTAAVVEGRNRIPVTLHRLAERRLPVRFQHNPEDRIAQVTVEPATVLVRGPQEVVERARAIPTLPCNLPPQAEGASEKDVVTVGPVLLVQDLEGRPVRATPQAVTVRLTRHPPQKVYELTDVPVHFLCPANFALQPLFLNERAGKITLRLLGPPSDEPPAVIAFVDLTGRDGKTKVEPGLCEEPLKIHLPHGFQLAKDPPRAVAFRLVSADAGPKPPGP